VVSIAIVLAGVATILFGLRYLDEFMRRVIGPRDRYEFRFADIQCNLPPATDRAIFLAEVRYVANMPETFHALTQEERERLTAAFGKHPWVDRVEAIDVEPPATVKVRLRFRVAVLAVTTQGGSVRLVDATGVLLPESPAPANIAVLGNRLPSPNTPAGHVWANETVRRAIELVAAYHALRLEKTANGWRLTLADGKALVVGE